MRRGRARLIADIHRLTPDGFDTSGHPLPPLRPMNALTLPGYLKQSGAELHMWRLLHNDPDVLKAVTAMRAEDNPAVGLWVPVHGDLRLDQFLISGGNLYLTDAEESRLGDPARDLGAFAGEWLYHAINRIPTVLNESRVVGHVPTHQEIVATGAAEVDRFSPAPRRSSPPTWNASTLTNPSTRNSPCAPPATPDGT
ncbi:hypothetical protein ACQ4WX_40730 [Streptomyces lasalocidi]